MFLNIISPKNNKNIFNLIITSYFFILFYVFFSILCYNSQILNSDARFEVFKDNNIIRRERT